MTNAERSRKAMPQALRDHDTVEVTLRGGMRQIALAKHIAWQTDGDDWDVVNWKLIKLEGEE